MPTSMGVPSVDAAAPARGVSSFRPNGLTVVLDYKLPIDNNITCSIAGAYTAVLSPGNTLYLTTQLAYIL